MSGVKYSFTALMIMMVVLDYQQINVHAPRVKYGITGLLFITLHVHIVAFSRSRKRNYINQYMHTA